MKERACLLRDLIETWSLFPTQADLFIKSNLPDKEELKPNTYIFIKGNPFIVHYINHKGEVATHSINPALFPSIPNITNLDESLPLQGQLATQLWRIIGDIAGHTVKDKISGNCASSVNSLLELGESDSLTASMQKEWQESILKKIETHQGQQLNSLSDLSKQDYIKNLLAKLQSGSPLFTPIEEILQMPNMKT